MFALTISPIEEMLRPRNATTCHDRCSVCGSDLVTTVGPGRTLAFHGVTIALPHDFKLVRCHGCGDAQLTPDQEAELHDKAERGGLPVLRDC
jgi:ribosomal protein S27E